VRFGSFPSIVVLGPFLPSTSLARHLRLYSHRQSCSSDVALVSVIVSVIVSSPAVAGFSPLSFVSVVPVITVVGACPLSSSLSSAARGITRPSHRFLSSSPLFICAIFYPSSSLSSSVVPVIVCRRRCPFLSFKGRVSVSASVVVACHLFRRLSSSIYRRLRLSFIVSVSICHRIIICRRLSEAFVFAAVRFLGSGHGSPRQRHHEPSDAHWHRRVVRKETPEDDRREMTTNNDEGYLADNERRLQRRHAQRRRHSTSRTDRGRCPRPVKP